MTHDEQHQTAASLERTEFPLSSYVTESYPPSLGNQHRPPTKLHPYRQGPYRVVNFIGDRYTVHNLVTNKTDDVHILRLEKFNYDPERDNLRDIANRDYQLRELESISTHKGVAGRPLDMEFLCKWVDIPATHSQEPYSS